MMKPTRTLSLVPALLLCAAVLTSCGQGDDIAALLPVPGDPSLSGGNGDFLHVIATKPPFEGEGGTRTNIDFTTFETSFRHGDQIGVTAVKDGVAVEGCDNLPITWNSSGYRWVGDIPYVEGATYIAYSPYNAVTMNGKTTALQIYDAFNVPEDQQRDFAKSDLMTSSVCTVDKSNKTLAVKFEHRMALLEIPPVLQGRTTANNWKYPIKNSEPYIIRIGDIKIAPYQRTSTGPYYCLFKPGSNLPFQISYRIKADMDAAVFNVLWEGGTKTFNMGYRYKINPSKTRNIEMGDIYYSDGGIFPSNLGLTPPFGKLYDNIGVVFAVGVGEGDGISNYAGTGLTGAIHGYVIALTDAATSSVTERTCTMATQLGLNFYINSEINKSAFNGYINTNSIKHKGFDEGYACGYVTNYQSEAPYPDNCSGWYIPSYAQMKWINTNADVIGKAILDVGGTAIGKSWTSTGGATGAKTVYYYDGGTSTFKASGTTTPCKVRGCLTF